MIEELTRLVLVLLRDRVVGAIVELINVGAT
jgi:hypothetical protein